jgi:hypothetical protein
MSQLTSAILTQIAFKRLSGKAMSSGKLSLAEEELGSTVQSSATTILGQVVPNAPALTDYLIQSASDGGPGTVQRVVFDLLAVEGTEYLNTSGTEVQAISGVTANTISPRQGFDAALGDVVNNVTDTYHAYTLKLPNNYQTVGGTDVGFATHASTPKSLGDAPFINSFNSTGSVQMQVVPEYLSTVIGSSNAYIPKLFATTGDEITPGSTIDWYFDAMAGVLFVADPPVDNTNPESPPSNANQPGTLKAFLYVGRYQSEIEGDSVDLHFSASEGTGFSFANNATASFTSGSGGGLTVTAGATNNIEFELVNVISGSEQVQDSLDGVSLFRITSSTGTDDIDLQFGQTASFIDGGAGLTVQATGNTTRRVEIGKTTDNVTFNQITGSDLIITNTASISYLETIYETASIIYTSGSTKFGNTLDDFHDFTGSINLSSSGLDGFTWDTPQGSNITIPLVYDVDNKRVLTGSDYFKKNEFGIHLSASEGTGFSLTNLSTASFTSGSGGGLTVTAGTLNNIEFELVGVFSSSEQLPSGILSSSTQDFAAYSSSVETLIINATASITQNETDITNATASIADLVVSQSEGFLLIGGTDSTLINGGNVLPFGTASFVGTNGIVIAPAGIGSTQLNVTFAENNAPSTIAISASNGITSIAYGGTASFTSSGAGLSVGQTAGTVTYTITPDDVLNGATDTATFNFTSSVAVSSSYALSSSYAVTASYAENAGSVSVTEDNATNDLQTVIFSSLEDDDAGGSDVNEDVTLKAANFLSVDAGRKYLYISGGDGYTRIEQDAIQTSISPTYDILTTGTPTTINMGVATGTVFLKGSASIAGDLIVNGTTTTINTDTLQIEDKYILLASGAAAAGGGTNAQGGGIVVERSAQNIGTALHWNEAAAVWAVDVADADSTSTSALTVDATVVFVKNDASVAPTAAPTIGDGDYRFGQMYVQDTAVADGNGIWIYAP